MLAYFTKSDKVTNAPLNKIGEVQHLEYRCLDLVCKYKEASLMTSFVSLYFS